MTENIADLTYAQAITELEAILKQMEADGSSIDELARDVERAAALITFCRERLRATEIRVHDVVANLSENA